MSRGVDEIEDKPADGFRILSALTIFYLIASSVLACCGITL